MKRGSHVRMIAAAWLTLQLAALVAAPVALTAPARIVRAELPESPPPRA